MQASKRIHILGICGTFMGSLAQLARDLGHQVSGSDAGVYPPMSEQLEAAGIQLTAGFDPVGIPDDVDEVIIGNAMSRGNPSVEFVLERGIPYRCCRGAGYWQFQEPTARQPPRACWPGFSNMPVCSRGI
jgi:UDP-N-acetylmuramate-alanine ligase